MKYFITIIISILLFFSLKAQIISVSEGLPFKSDDIYELLGRSGDHFVLYRNSLLEFEFLGFNEQLRLDWKKSFELFGRRPKVLDVASDGELIHIVYLVKEKGITKLLMNQYDIGANFKDSVTIYNYGKRYYSPNPFIQFSENKTVLTAYHFEKDKGIEALAFDINRFDLLWYKKLEKGIYEDIKDFQQSLIDNDGNLYFVFSQKNFKSKNEEHYLDIYKLSSLTDEPLRIAIPMKGYFTYDILFELDELNQNLVAAGLFSKNNRNIADGTFFLSISLDDSRSFIMRFEEFEASFVERLIGNKSKLETSIEDVDIQEIVLRQDGGILMVAELNYAVERYSGTNARPYAYGSSYSISYFYDDIFVYSIHPDGSIHWKTTFYKKQFSQDDDGFYSSYYLVKTPFSLRFLFNDEIKKENTVSEYILSGSGKYTRNSVMSTKGQKIKLRFVDALQTASDEVYVPSDFRGKLRLVRIRY